MLNAWSFGENRGTPLNIHVVVHWERLGLVAERSILERQGQLLDRLGKWLCRRKKPLAYVWTVEFSSYKGAHTHLLLAARLQPRDLSELGRSLPRFLAGWDVEPPPRTIEVARNLVRLPYDPSRCGWVAGTEDQRRGLIAYLLKGTEPTAAAAAGIHAEDQGVVRVRRCGVARALDWTARRRAGWKERLLEEFDFADLRDRRCQSLRAAAGSPLGRPKAA